MWRNRCSARLILALFILFLGALPAIPATVYSWDDGAAEISVGAGSPPNTMAWFNGFQVLPGMEVITGIQIVFRGDPRVSNGDPVTLYLWTDPNNDGLAGDAVVARSLTTTVSNVGTGIFNSYPIVPITLPVGDWFYVGALYSNPSDLTRFIGAFDTTSPQLGVTWFASWISPTVPDPNALGSADFPAALMDNLLAGNWLIRAEASAIPEPGTVLLLGAGLVVLSLIRKYR